MTLPRLTQNNPQPIEAPWNAGSNEASWRSGYAEDCKSLHPGSIPGEASNPDYRCWRRRAFRMTIGAGMAPEAGRLEHER